MSGPTELVAKWRATGDINADPLDPEVWAAHRYADELESALAAERRGGRVTVTGEHLWKAFGNALGLTSWAHSPEAWRKPYEDAAEHLNRMLTNPTPEASR